MRVSGHWYDFILQCARGFLPLWGKEQQIQRSQGGSNAMLTPLINSGVCLAVFKLSLLGTYTNTHFCAHVWKQTLMWPETRMHRGAFMYVHAHIHAHTQRDAHTNTHAWTHTHTYINTHILKHTHIHACTCVGTHTQTCSHTHTHEQARTT